MLEHFLISCKNFQELCFLNLARNEVFVRVLQDLGRNKLSGYTLRSDNLCISPKERIINREVKFDEICTC